MAGGEAGRGMAGGTAAEDNGRTTDGTVGSETCAEDVEASVVEQAELRGT